MRISRVSLALAAAGVVAIRGEVRVAASPSPGDGPALSRDVRPVGEKPGRFRAAADRPALARGRQGRQGLRGAGALAGKAVYLSAGHGWLYSAGAWRTQRGNTHDLVEDFITIEGVNEHLVRYLQLMGAYVVPIREADRNPNQVVVDDPDAAIEGEVAEVAEAGAGWAPFPAPFDDDALAPFGRGGARAMTAAAAETGRAVFAAAIPETGFYNVYLAYVQGPDRAPDAHVIVRHSGGESHLRIDQRRHGSTWVLLGRWHFEAGAGPARASLAVANDSGEPGRVVSFDAARFGGGMAPHSRGGATTGRPAYESAAAYQAQLLGAPRTVYDYFANDQTDDVVARPRFAAWEHEAGEDAIYLAWHTNAPDPGRGTLSIAYGNTYPCCAGLDDFAGTAGSLELLHAVHGELVADLRAAWDPGWRDQGKATAALGELSPAHNPEMPAILVELGFHSTAADAEALRDPRFRAIAARAMAQGVARYFAAADGRPLVLPPEPPIAVRVENAGPGTLRVSWRPPPADPAGGDAPAGYRVYVSENGLGFDDGVEAAGESLELTGLPRAALRFVRVAAVNAGGESMPTEVVGARVAAAGAAPTLIVGGFDRLDRSQVIRDPAPLVGEVDRVWLDRMNDGTYAARHGRALAAAGYAFDGATDEAVAARDVDLTAYRAIDWFAGEDAAGALPAEARAELARFFDAGGGLLVSGAELIWALDTQGGEDERRFARDVLHVSLAADDAESYDAVPLGGPFAELAPLSFLDLAPGGYDVRFPDVLVPAAGATPVLAYGAPGGGAAAIAWEAGTRGVVLGFPLEVVQGEDARRALVDAALSYLGVEKDPDAPGDPGSEDPAGCGCAGGGGAGTWAPAAFVALLFLGRLRRRRRR